MAAGLTRRQRYNATVTILKRLCRRYNGKYADWNATGKHKGKRWSAYVKWGNMSNGESVGQLIMVVNGKRVQAYYGSHVIEAAFRGEQWAFAGR